LISNRLKEDKFKVLVWENLPENRLQLEILVKNSDIELNFCSNFVDYSNNFDTLPDLIMLNIDIEPIKGLELCHYLKTNRPYSQIPLIVYSQSCNDELFCEAFKAGATDYLTWPLKSELNLHKLLVRLQAHDYEEFANQRIEELKELNAVKDKFLSIIAHDLKSPFSNLIGFSELLLDDYETMDEDSVKTYHHILYTSAKQGWLLLENLLQWTRAQTGRLEIKPQVINLNEFLTEAVYMLRLELETKRIDIVPQIATDSAMVIADPNILRTVFRNLLSNAIKFSYSDSKVFVTSELDGNNIRVSVIDNGLGIKPEHLPKLFRLDVHHSTLGTADEKGTGLGLIITKDFIEKCGGKISVDSEFGKGSKFTFYFNNANK
jgi:two-component system, sensor histidine kinase and response regulator